MFRHHLLTALRALRRNWITSSINLLGMSVGLACSLGAVGVVEYFELEDAQYPGSERTYFIQSTGDAQGSGIRTIDSAIAPWAVADYLRTSVENDGVARITHPANESVNVNGVTHELRTSFADSQLFNLFPLPFQGGERTTALKDPRTAVITVEAARRLFGTIDAVGKRMMLEGREAVTVVGVLADIPQPSHLGSSFSKAILKFDALFSADLLRRKLLWTGKADQVERSFSDWGGFPLTTSFTYIRLKSANYDSLAALNANLEAQRHRYESSENTVYSARPIRQLREQSLNQFAVNSGLRWSSVLLIAAGIVLGASIINYANLAGAALLTRRRELGVRRVVGASTRQLAVQTTVESALVGTAALILGFTLLALLSAPLPESFGVDLLYVMTRSSRFLFMTLLGWCATCIAITVYPLFVTRQLVAAPSLQDASRRTPNRRSLRWLVAVQFAMASVLLVGILIVRTQLDAARKYALDSLPDPIVVIDNNLRAQNVNFDTLRAELLKQTGIAAVSGTSHGLWGGPYDVMPMSTSLDVDARRLAVMGISVGPGYFDTLNIKPLAGETFDQIGDYMRFTPNIRTIIDRSTARALGFDRPQDAIGKSIYPAPEMTVLRKANVSLFVIGVVEDKPWQFSNKGAVGTVFQRPIGYSLSPVIRLEKRRIAEGVAGIEHVWQSIAPNYILKRAFLDERIEQYLAEQTFVVRMTFWITLLASTIALSGLIGMAVYATARRRHEVGVRKTLGASTSQVALLFLRDFSLPIVIGNLFAWPLAYLATQPYVSQFAHQAGFSILPFVGGLMITVTVGALAVAWPSLRAARMSPANVLRHE